MSDRDKKLRILLEVYRSFLMNEEEPQRDKSAKPCGDGVLGMKIGISNISEQYETEAAW